jgi:hypothetical protein
MALLPEVDAMEPEAMRHAQDPRQHLRRTLNPER